MANKIESYNQLINKSLDDIIKIVEKTNEKDIRWKPSESEWSIIQVLSHLNEATPYWLSEIERVIDHPGSEWGRGLENEPRLAAVEQPDSLNLHEVIKEFKGLKQLVSAGLSKVSESQLENENPHRNFKRFGNKPILFIIEHFIDEHTANHYNQIQRNLSNLQ